MNNKFRMSKKLKISIFIVNLFLSVLTRKSNNWKKSIKIKYRNSKWTIIKLRKYNNKIYKQIKFSKILNQ